MKNLALLLFLITSVLACTPKGENQSNEEAANSVVSLDEKEFSEKLSSGKALLVDVRTAEEIASGKIPNAISIDFYRTDFQDEILILPKEQEILIYCSAGVRSLQASEFLAKNGYSKIYHLEGGLGNWVRKGYPFE